MKARLGLFSSAAAGRNHQEGSLGPTPPSGGPEEAWKDRSTVQVFSQSHHGSQSPDSTLIGTVGGLCATCNFFPTLKSQQHLGGQCYYRDTMESVLIYHKNKQFISLVFWSSLVIHFAQGPLNLRRSSSSPPMHSCFPGEKGSGDNKELEGTV